MASIKEHGIINPLVVEDYKNGNYLLVDGERRFRAATELKLKDVPVIVTPPMSATDRLVRQFHLQEQHQSWTATEKAVVIGQLAEELKMTVGELAKLLALPQGTVKTYEGFYSLLERVEFQKSEIPVNFAGYIVRLRSFTKKLYENIFEEEFDQNMQRQLESTVISHIKKGDIVKNVDITRLRDAFVKNPDTIKEFIKGKSTVAQLYLKSNAKVAHHARNVWQLANVLSTHINACVKLGGVELLADDQNALYKLSKLKIALDDLITKLK
jgi:ParB family chromosome partitioning protein